MAKLRSEQKRFIVQRLACFETPTEVQTALKEVFLVDVALPQILYYDPNSAGTELAQAWRELFQATRKNFVEDTSTIAIAQKAFRLKRLERMARALEECKNYELAAKLYEQGAKDAGNAFTNRRELTGRDGEPIAAEVVFELKIGRPAGALAVPTATEEKKE